MNMSVGNDRWKDLMRNEKRVKEGERIRLGN